MASGKYTRYTDAATQAEIDCPATSRVSFVVKSENGDGAATVQGFLKENWYPVSSSWTDGEISCFVGPLEKVRLVTTDLGTGAYIDFEVIFD